MCSGHFCRTNACFYHRTGHFRDSPTTSFRKLWNHYQEFEIAESNIQKHVQEIVLREPVNWEEQHVDDAKEYH